MVHRFQKLRIVSIMLLLAVLGAHLPAQMTKSEIKESLRMMQAAPTFEAVIDSLSKHDYHPDSLTIGVMREALWQRLLEDQNRFPARKIAFEAGNCEYLTNQIGEFSIHTKGARPNNGYPVYIGLHGGGGGPKEMNDAQWEQMQTYYLKSIDTGIYVAPRGPNNTWNLHFDSDAQAFYHQLIKDLRLFANADPNRIYLLGYSAGGDGVYQLGPRLASELAAASMSAGHHNGVNALNLQHLPMLLQVGELDAAYDRNIETVRYSLILDGLANRFPGDFRHQVYVHSGAEHSYVRDRMGPNYHAKVLAHEAAWLNNRQDTISTKAITDAATWLSKFRRNPYPLDLYWDLGTVLEGNGDWYWVSVTIPSENFDENVQRGFIRLKALENANRVDISRLEGILEIHLHEGFANPSKPLKIVVDGKSFDVPLIPSTFEIARTMEKSCDRNYSFWQTIKIWRDELGEIHVQ